MSSKAKSADKAKEASDSGESSKKPAANRRAKPLPATVKLEHGRSRHLGWIAFCAVVGLLFVLKLGSIGQYVGGLLLFIGVLQGVSALRTFLHKPGTFHVTEDEISLPTGLCKGKQLSLTTSQLEHAFFIRRAVPWSKAGPILVIEAEGKAYSYPRDWFVSDSDQRRVATALNHRLQNKATA